MKVIKRAFSNTMALAIAVSLFVSETALACTSIVLEANDGAAVYGRTMEWGSFDLNSRVAIVPRGYEFQGHTPDGKPGYRWKAQYGVVGLTHLKRITLPME